MATAILPRRFPIRSGGGFSVNLKCAEIRQCRRFLAAELSAPAGPAVILALGRVAHDSTLDALGQRRGDHPFAHAARHQLVAGRVLHDSYHCSRYNTQTRRLTGEMFEAVFAAIRRDLG